MDGFDSELEQWRARALEFERALNGCVLGLGHAVRLLIVSILARGHVLLEGNVGVGKTTLLRAAARGLGGAYERVEGTIDLMPQDLVYHTYIDRDGKPRVEPGPLIAHGAALSVFFFNEINRARPQVHSLLLRVMAERSVSAFNREFRFPHLLVFADRNRVEREETFEIASAARDRFMMEVTIDVPADTDDRRALMFDPRYHDTDSLIESLAPGLLDYRELNGVAAQIQHSVQASDALQKYALDLWRATAAPADYGVKVSDLDTAQLMLAGASPRGMSMLLRAARVAAWLDGRSYATPEDLQSVFEVTIAHRLCYQPVYEMRRHEIAGPLIAGILANVAAP